MQILTPLLVMMRARQLGRQFRDIERSVRALPKRNRERLSTLTLREIGQASRSDFPHLYGTAPEARYLPWGQGTEAGYERACSNNAELALRIKIEYERECYRQAEVRVRERLHQLQSSVGETVKSVNRTEQPTR